MVSEPHFEYPTSAGECYVADSDPHLEDTHPDRLLLDADIAASFIASLISSFTGDEVDGDGDPWTISCEHLSTLLGNLGAALARPDAEPTRRHLHDEYGLDPNDLRTDDEKARDADEQVEHPDEDRQQHPYAGDDADPDSVLAGAEALIDFTRTMLQDEVGVDDLSQSSSEDVRAWHAAAERWQAEYAAFTKSDDI